MSVQLPKSPKTFLTGNRSAYFAPRFSAFALRLSKRELYWDGKVVTLFTPAQKYYSQVEFTGMVGELVKKLEERYNVEVPMSDLFTWGTPAAPLDKLESAMNAGQDFIGKDLRS
jgi:hypothetical protein